MFAVSVGAVLAYVYYNTAVILERQIDETVRAEVQGLADQYRLRGLRGLIDAVSRRTDNDTGAVYILIGPGGQRFAGNIDTMPAEADGDEDWIDFPLDVLKNDVTERHTARGYHADLSNGFELLVGRDVEELRQFTEIIRNTLFGALAIALVLGLGGGLAMSRNFLRRVDAITAASRTIMAGDLAGRMPVSGSNDELDRLAQSLNEMLDQIERLMAGMREVSSNVAHDLRTPLTRLRARVEGALRSGDTVSYREALDQTIAESDHLLATFNALLSIARAEAGQTGGELLPLDARTILTEVVELYEPIAEEAGGKLVLAAGVALPVRGDRQLLAQAISNLVDNALKYGVTAGCPNPDIRIEGHVEGREVIVTVADRGGGIPAADRKRVIERFVRLDESRTKPGSGLGLSLVAGVMRLHGGSLSLEDNAPGLTARLTLPLGDEKIPS